MLKNPLLFIYKTVTNYLKTMKPKRIFKRIAYLLFFIILISSCQKRNRIVSPFSLNKADGIYKYQEKPFTGMVLDTTASGRVLLSFKCIDGKIDGEYLEYYKENGNLKEKTTYQNGKKSGPYRKSTKDGGTIQIGEYLDYKKNGEWKTYHNNGKIKSQGSYENGSQSGEWRYFFNNGQLQAIGKYLNGNESNLGQTGIPINGRIGEWKFYFKDTGSLSQVSEFENGLRSGKFIVYYQNGQIELKANCVKDKYHGTVEVFDESGELELREHYENGELVESKK